MSVNNAGFPAVDPVSGAIPDGFGGFALAVYVVQTRRRQAPANVRRQRPLEVWLRIDYLNPL